MSLRPGTVCKLERGKLIDSQRGFVDTFNWLVDFCSNLNGDGERIEVDKSMTDAPVVRLVEEDEEEPSGGGTVTVVGTDGSTATAEAGKITFASAEDSSVTATVAADGEGNVTVTLGVHYK